MEKIWLEHKHRYPEMTVQDMVKLLYQREFGGGHLITDEQQSLERIRQEYQTMESTIPVPEQSGEDGFSEVIGGRLSRLSLTAISQGLAPETLNRMFVLTAKEVQGNKEHLQEMLDGWLLWLGRYGSAKELAEAVDYVKAYAAQGYPMVSHSSHYRDCYHPAYRIVAERFVDCLEICCDIDRLLALKTSADAFDPVVVAIDGCSASGKTTAAKTLAQLYDCNLFHMDDFFLRPEQRTPERFRQPGGNVDYERFAEEVLRPLLSGSDFLYRRFDCRQQRLTDEIEVRPKCLNIVEGAYSRHPYFGDRYQLTYWFFVAPEEQKRRILERNGAVMLDRFIQEWIPLENAYFQAQGINPMTELR